MVVQKQASESVFSLSGVGIGRKRRVQRRDAGRIGMDGG